MKLHAPPPSLPPVEPTLKAAEPGPSQKVRIEDPLFASVLFGVYFGLFVWGGLYLRDDHLRALIPVKREGRNASLL